jgi:hypothetical protein
LPAAVLSYKLSACRAPILQTKLLEHAVNPK